MTTYKPMIQLLSVGVLALLLSACAGNPAKMETTHQSPPACVSDVRTLLHNANLTEQPGRFLAAADTALACADTLANRDQRSADQVKLRANAILALIRAGHASRAKAELAALDNDYPDSDLMLAGGLSFRDSVKALLENNDNQGFALSQLNISEHLAEEVSRKNYWLTH